MQKKRLSTLAAAVVLGLAGLNASAGLLDGLGKVTDTIKKASDAVQSAGSAAGGTVPGGSSSQKSLPNGSSYQLPMGFEAYPKAELQKRLDNPYDSLTIPVVVPVNGPDGYLSPYTVPVEGKVTMLQYEHRQDDSPALIMRHYLAWLSAQGFEVVTVCAAPCKALESGYSWSNVADASRRIDTNYLPSRPAYVAAYKPGAMALVGVGTFINRYSSFVKLVEGKVGDLSGWQRVASRPQPTATGTVSSSASSSQAAAPAAPQPVANEPKPPADWDGPADWYGRYGWMWDRMPAGLKLTKTDFLNLPTVGYFAGTTGSEPELGQLKPTDTMIYRANYRNGYVLISTAKGEVWVDSRQVRPISAKVEAGQKAAAGVTNLLPAAKASAKPVATGLQDGAELKLKLKSVKLLSAPVAEGKVLATLSSEDGVIYMGTETAGYLQVTTGQGDGWLDKRLVKLP